MKKFVTFIIIASVLSLLNLKLAFEVEDIINESEQVGHIIVIVCIVLSLLVIGLLIKFYLSKRTGNKLYNSLLFLIILFFSFAALVLHSLIYIVYFVQGPIG